MTQGNVVLLTVDALRADHTSLHSYGRDTTPRLDEFASDNLVFQRCFSASSHTREAVPALLTGRYPDEAVDAGYRLNTETIAGRLRSQGYSTAAYHSNPYLSRAYGYGGGFEEFNDDLRFGGNKLLALLQRGLDKLRNRHYASAETINRRALSWLDEAEEPFFLWNHYMDPHGPYQPPEEYRAWGNDMSGRAAQKLYKRAVQNPESVREEERRGMIDMYDAEIRYVDACIGRFLDALGERGLLKDSLVMITADHGDAFGEHGYYGHPRELHDELLHVPLVISGEEPTTGGVDVPASTLDVTPTILESTGVPHTLPGESLYSMAATPENYRERKVYSQVLGENGESGLRKFSVRSVRSEGFLIRDAKTGELIVEDGDYLEELRHHSKERVGGGGEANGETTTDAAVKGRLEALGYKE